MLSAPYVTAVGIAESIVQAYPIWIPADVRFIDVYLSNRNCFDGNHGGQLPGVAVAVGTPNPGLTAWAKKPTIVSGLTLPAGGAAIHARFSTVGARNAAGYIMVGTMLPAGSGSYVPEEDSAGWGLFGRGTTDLSGLKGVSPRAVGSGIPNYGFLSVQYQTGTRQLVSYGDSITRGVLAGWTSTPEHSLGRGGGSYVAGMQGCGLLQAAQVAGSRSFDWDVSRFNDVGLVRLGTNDLIAGSSLAELKAHLKTVMVKMRSAGAKKVGIATLLPSSSYSAARNGEIVALNSQITALSLGNDFAVDIYLVLKDPKANQILPSYRSDAVHPNAAGQSAMKAAFPTTLP